MSTKFNSKMFIQQIFGYTKDNNCDSLPDTMERYLVFHEHN